ncbi:MAG: flagellar basal body-associated protein FliL, partial [Pseudomonadota bacterium]
MRALILPLILAVFGAGAGAGAGWFLKPKPEMAEEKSGKEESGQEAASARNGKPGEQDKDGEGNDTTEFVKLNNQFIIPVVNN